MVLNNYQSVIEKLNAFIKKYYTKLLIKGGILFLVLGMLFFLVITALEYFLWMGPTARLAMLVIFVGVTLGLLYSYVCIPLFYLLKIRKGISKREASVLIGRHFTVVDDKLLNLLDLADNEQRSNLLIAAIEQRSKELKPIPFAQAVNLKEGFRYAKYGIAPILVIALVWLSGNISEFFGSYKRVVNYDVAYEPPAPFSFQLVNQNLNVLEDEVLTLEVTTTGKVRPETMSVVVDGKAYVMQDVGGTNFTYRLEPPLQSGLVYFIANGFKSRSYQINVGRVPSLQRFEMVLDYPSYLKKRKGLVKGTGNATVPEGTKIGWRVTGIHTNEVKMQVKDTVFEFKGDGNSFSFDKNIFSRFAYEISTSNESVEDYEKLGYEIKVIPDAYPVIRVQQVLDSLNPNISYYEGSVTDDIGLKDLSLVVYPRGAQEQAQRLSLGNSGGTIEQFYYTFPSGLALEPGMDYLLYFEVMDNDGLRGGKVTKSKVFNTKVLDTNQLKDKELEFQQKTIQNLDRSLDGLKEQKEVLKEINDKQKENKRLDFNEQSQVRDFLKRQQQQEQLMEKYSKQLKENLKKTGAKDEQNRLLQERLERQEIEARKNQRLLEELDKMADKIEQEDLKKALEEQAKKQSNSERNLEQLLELTKRYYVTEKAAQLGRELEKLAQMQKEAAEIGKKDSLDAKMQEALNSEFNKLSKELEELKKDNEALKKPLDLNAPKEKGEAIKQDQKEALEELNKSKGEEQSSGGKQPEESKSTAAKKQRSAAQKMKELSEGLSQSASSAGGGSEVAEDAEMLRQILDNLVKFSFNQEKLFDVLQDSGGELNEFSNTVKEQKQLRRLFEHVDDSLFALSLRRAELSEFVNEQVTEVYYNIDKSLESIAENQVFQGASYQQYVLTASNSLSDFLSKILENMQQSMQSGQGQGDGDGFQLPDIIKGQQQLGDRIKEAGKQGQKGKEGQGEAGKEGKSGKQGKGSEGQQGGDGSGGEKGKKGQGGKDGNQDGSGKQGADGDGTEQRGDGKGTGEENGGEGNGNAISEAELRELFEIYKEQQELRNRLEQQLDDILQNDKRELAKKLVKQMEVFEEELLRNGITEQTLNRVNRIQQQLLRLENAALKQGQKKERESNTNTNGFNNPITTKPELLLQKRSGVEILNRQALPLRQNFKGKVKRYFTNGD